MLDSEDVSIPKKPIKDSQIPREITRFQEVYGVQVPTQPRELQLLPAGERQWRYITFVSDDTSLKNDYYVETDDRAQFRVVSVEPWGSFSKYLFQECPRAGSAGEPAEDLAAEASS